jgi:hypothetical protein
MRFALAAANVSAGAIASGTVTVVLAFTFQT